MEKLSFMCIWVSASSICFHCQFERPFHGVSSPPKIWRVGRDFFTKNVFQAGQILWKKFIGGLFYVRELMIRSYQGRSSFTKCVFQKSEYFKSEDFSQSWWNIHFNIKAWPLYRIMEGFILKLIFERLGGFDVVSCYLRYWYIIWDFNTRGLKLKSTLSIQYL